MENQVLFRVRFAFIDSTKDAYSRIKRFETFFQNIFYIFVRTKDRVSLEMFVSKGSINFYFAVPSAAASSVNSLLFSVFPDAEVKSRERYDGIDDIPRDIVSAFEARLVGSEAFTLRTIAENSADPLNPFLDFLGSIPQGDGFMYQIIVDPINETVESTGGAIYGVREKEGRGVGSAKFQASIRFLYFAESDENSIQAQERIQNIFSSFATEQNQLDVIKQESSQQAVEDFFSHKMSNVSTLTTEELASLYHAPDPEAKIRGINWLFSRKAEPPMSLPTLENTPEDDLSVFGETDFRGKLTRFGIKRIDRTRHLYVSGKSGVGKSKLLEQLIINDINYGHGVCLIDPHGDLVQNLLQHVPEDRIDDVVYFNPSDLDMPIAFNPIENVDREFKQQVIQGLIEIFKKFFGADWTPKIEHVFRFTALALLDYKKATLMGMQMMLTDRSYRQEVVAEIQDQVVKKFWANEFSSWSEKFDNEAIVPLINKLGQFLSNEMVRNIVAQQKNKVDFGDIMNNQKILFVELSKGKLGEENSALLGSLIITKIQQQGMARAFIAEKDRKDFYLYVDEFQHFATETFENIFSEARKYRLNLTVSHQYLGQLSDSVRETIFGNVGSLITFRMGAGDAKYLSQELTPRFRFDDIMNLGVREMYIKMSIDGVLTPAFSAHTVDVVEPDIDTNYIQKIIDASRKKYSTPVGDVEKEIADGPQVKPPDPGSVVSEPPKPEVSDDKGGADDEAGFEAPLV